MASPAPRPARGPRPADLATGVRSAVHRSGRVPPVALPHLSTSRLARSYAPSPVPSREWTRVMTVPSLALLAASPLASASTTVAGTPASAAPSGHYDAPYAVFDTKGQPVAADHSAFSTSIRIRADSGDDRSAEIGLAIRPERVTAVNGGATAAVNDVAALEGPVLAASISARCHNDVAVSQIVGRTVGRRQGTASLPSDARSRNQDGSTTATVLKFDYTPVAARLSTTGRPHAHRPRTETAGPPRPGGPHHLVRCQCRTSRFRRYRRTSRPLRRTTRRAGGEQSCAPSPPATGRR
jgi:hypothetical protein